jgi:hypothetical protein
LRAPTLIGIDYFQLLGGFDAQEVDQPFARFDRNRRDRIAGLGRGLGGARPDRVLIISNSDRAVRAILILLCMVAIVPVTMRALARIMRVEARNGYRACQKALTRSLR